MNPLLPSDQKNLLSLSGIEMSGLSLEAATKERRKAGVGLSQKRRSWVKPVCAGDVRPDTEQGVVSRVKPFVTFATFCSKNLLSFCGIVMTGLSFRGCDESNREDCSNSLCSLQFPTMSLRSSVKGAPRSLSSFCFCSGVKAPRYWSWA